MHVRRAGLMLAGLERIGPVSEAEDEASYLDLMAADFPHPKYPINQVKRAGEALGGTLYDYDERTAQLFNIAYNWRDSHAFPMRRMRDELKGKIRKSGHPGITAARTKRMASIRKKLSRSSIELSQMQDLGGCRAIMQSIGGVRALIELYSVQGRHDLAKTTSYIDKPKLGGYLQV
jgi:(p)ppGpp synthase/HD superfamily hydrolase